MHDHDRYGDEGPGMTRWQLLWVIAAAAMILIALGIAAFAQAADIRSSAKDIDARDRPFLTPAASQNENWTAIWGAALAGYSMSNTELSLDAFGRVGEDDTRRFNLAHVDGFGGEGWTGDLQLGGDIQIGRVVLGVFGEYSFGGTESSISVFGDAARLKVEQDDSWSILARAGIASGNTLFYVASGYTETTFEATLRAGDGGVSRDLDFSGIPLELGIEHKFGPNVRGRLAGRYTWLDEEAVFDDREEGEGARQNAEPGIWSVKAGVVISTDGLGLGIFSGN
jgi:hypothetical protein